MPTMPSSEQQIPRLEPPADEIRTCPAAAPLATRSIPQAKPGLPIVRLCGVPLHAITERHCIHHVLDELDAGRGGWIVTANLDFLRRLVRDASFATLCANASLIVADGMPLIWASRLQGTPLPERVAGSDLVPDLSAAAAERGRSVYLLGGAPGTAQAAAEMLLSRSPSLRIAGTACPPLGFEHDGRALAEVIENLVSTRPDIAYIALGSPKQEALIDRARSHLPATWWMGVGISFSYLCGRVRRAPRWMQRLGLEWVQRLVQEPGRLAKRYLLQGIPFAVALLGEAMTHRLSDVASHSGKRRNRHGAS